MKRIAFLIGTLSSGGAERVVSNLTHFLDTEYKVVTILFGSESKIDYSYSGEIVYLDKKIQNNVFIKIYNLITRVKSLSRLKKTYSDMIVISFLEYCNLLNLLSYKKNRTIISVRNHMSSKHKRGIQSFFWNLSIKTLYPLSDKIIAVSNVVKNDLIEKYRLNPEQISVIYNSYDIQHIREASKELIEDEYIEIFKNPVIITAGRLSRQKGHWHLIRAFSKLKKINLNSKLVILGDGELKSYLIKLANDLGVGKDVVFLGFKSNPFKYMANSKLFIMSSLYEGFPNSLSEAMACGVPIISSDCLSGPREILAPNEVQFSSVIFDFNSDRFGILIPVCDGIFYDSKQVLTKEEEIMMEKMKLLLDNQELLSYYSNKSLIRIQDFNVTKVASQWIDIISELNLIE